MKDLYLKGLILLITAAIIIILCPFPVRAEIYPSYVLLTIRSRGEIIGQDEFFELLDRDDYVLLPLVSLSRWLEIDLNYYREDELLEVYYEKEDISIMIDYKYEIYYDFPEWSTDPPEAIEGDFYVAVALVEHLTGARVEWLPARQELILDFDYIAEEVPDEIPEIIKERPEEPLIEPDVTGLDFSIGSIQYKIGFDYRFGDDTREDALFFNNLINVHGRAGDWSLSARQLLEYDFTEEELNLEYPILRARNPENDRLIVLGDTRFSLPNTLGRVNLRGVYLQYPLHTISDRRAFTSVRGEAEEGSRVTLYANERRVGEEYIYQGEDQYHFENVPLTAGRTNILRVVIEDLEGREKEIVKKVAGSLHIFEEGTSEAVLAAGMYNRSAAADSLFEVGGVQLKYAPAAGTSLFWELGVKRVFDNSEYQGIDAGSLVRVALRPEDIPLVFLADWLAGSEVNLIEHGARVSTLYTREDGSINASLSYVPPVVGDNVSAETGLQALVNLEQELSENWQVEVELENIRSILDMEDYDLSRINLVFDYRDRARNSFVIATEIARRNEEKEWKDLDLIEESRRWFDILLQGRTIRGSTRLGGEIIYVLSEIDFQDSPEGSNDSKREDFTSIKLNFSSSLTDELVLSGGFESSFTWLEGSWLESDSSIDLRAGLRTGAHTFVTAGISSELEYNKDDEANGFTEEVRVLELFVRHNIPRHITFNAGVKNTYLAEESYFSGNAGFLYQNQENDWKLAMNYEYISPFGDRETPQQRASLEYSRHLISGLEGVFNIRRIYASRRSEEAFYQASIGFSQVLGFAGESLIGQEYQRGEHSSYIAGLVYLDLDGTGRRDPDDPLLEDISIFRDRSGTTTDKDGKFVFENVRPGLYEVGFNLGELADDYRVVTADKLVQIRENENIFLEFGLTKEGALGGRVMIAGDPADENDREEIALSRVGLRVAELNRTVFTRGDGSFKVENLPLGEYTIRVMERSLPAGIAVSGEGVYQVRVSPDELEIQDIEILLTRKDRADRIDTGLSDSF